MDLSSRSATVLGRTMAGVLFLAGLALATARPSIAIKPYPDYPREPGDLGLAAETVVITTKDGVDLAGWWIPGDGTPTRGTVVFAYGDAGNMSYMLDYAAAFGTRGYDALTFDYRGFGASDPFEADLDRLIHAEYLDDLEAAVAAAAARSDGPVFLYGQSMGAVLALAVAARTVDVDGVVAEGPYTSTSAVMEIIGPREAAGGRRTTPPVDYPVDAEPLHAVARLGDRALLVLAGSRDDTATPAMAFDIYAACPSRTRSLWIAPDTGHGSIAADHTEVFVELVGSFLDHVVAAGGR